VAKGSLDLSFSDRFGGADDENLGMGGLRMGLLYDLTPEKNFTSVGFDWHMFHNQAAMDATISTADREFVRKLLSDEVLAEPSSRMLDRERYRGTKNQFVELGVMEDSPKYYREVTLMESVTHQCKGKRPWEGLSMRSDGHVDVVVEKIGAGQKDHSGPWGPWTWKKQ